MDSFLIAELQYGPLSAVIHALLGKFLVLQYPLCLFIRPLFLLYWFPETKSCNVAVANLETSGRLRLALTSQHSLFLQFYARTEVMCHHI